MRGQHGVEQAHDLARLGGQGGTADRHRRAAMTRQVILRQYDYEIDFRGSAHPGTDGIYYLTRLAQGTEFVFSAQELDEEIKHIQEYLEVLEAAKELVRLGMPRP